MKNKRNKKTMMKKLRFKQAAGLKVPHHPRPSLTPKILSRRSMVTTRSIGDYHWRCMFFHILLHSIATVRSGQAAYRMEAWHLSKALSTMDMALVLLLD
jgi:hypothetical protein